MSADLLRKAATEARKHAAGGRRMAALTSAMGDAVAVEAAGVIARHEAVADWLDHEADSYETTELWFHPDDGVSIQEDKDFMFKHALAVARAYLGNES